MKKSDIVVGGLYEARVSGTLVTVRVDAIRETCTTRPNRYSGQTDYKYGICYDVVNLRTGRRLIFRSPRKFRRMMGQPMPDRDGILVRARRIARAMRHGWDLVQWSEDKTMAQMVRGRSVIEIGPGILRRFEPSYYGRPDTTPEPQEDYGS